MNVISKQKQIYLFLWAKPYWKIVSLTLCLAIIIGILSPLRPWIIEYTIDNYIKKDNLTMLYYMALVQVGLIIVEIGLYFLFNYLSSWIGNTVVRDMRKDVYHHILQLQQRQFDKTPIGILTTRTIDDMERISEVFSNGLLSIIADILSIVSILLYMFFTDSVLTLICLIPFSILLITTYYFQKSVKKSFQQVRTAVGKLNAFVQEHLMGIHIIQAFGVEEQETQKFNTINAQHKKANIRSILAYSMFFPVVDIVLALSIGLIVWKSASDETYRGINVDAGIIIAFILALNLIFRPLRIMAEKYNVIQMGIISFHRILEILKNNDFVEQKKSNISLYNIPIAGKIEFKNVHLDYGQQEVLKKINFIVDAGQTVALVGRTGSGKTSIISLLNRSYPISKGHIYIDDRDILEYPLYTLRAQIGTVLQDVFLFSGTIFDNITLHNPNITLTQVKEVCGLIGIDHFIETLPNKYFQYITSKDTSLSLGQKQVIAFARVLLYDPKIIILDEATSSIDSASEKLIQNAIRIMVKNRTSIVVAHRLSTIEKADLILVIDQGKIVEQGTHKQLINNNSFYSKLYTTYNV